MGEMNRRYLVPLTRTGTPEEVRAAVDVGRQTGIFPLGAGVNERILAAVEEVRDLPDAQYPSTASVVANHPGVASYQVMTDPEYQQATKYDLLMRRLQAIQQEQPDKYKGSPAAEVYGPKPEPIRDRSFWAQQWGAEPRGAYDPVAPYRHRGLLAPGQPVRNAMEVMNIPFAAVGNNVVRPFFNLDKAADAQPKQLNKATGGLYNAFRGEDPNPQWSDEQRFVEAVDFDSPLMEGSQGNPTRAWDQLQARVPNQQTGEVYGDELLGDAGMSPGLARQVLGAVVEAPFDPFTTAIGPMVKNAGRAVRYASPTARNAALRRVGADATQEFVLPPAVLTGLLEAAKYGASQ